MFVSNPKAADTGLRFAVLATAALSLTVHTGCRSTTDNQIDILERELRSQEDYIYELEDYLLEYSEKLRYMRGTKVSHSASADSVPDPEIAAEPPFTDGPEIADEPSMPEAPPLRFEPSQPAAPADTPLDLEELDVPDLDIGNPTSQRRASPPTQMVSNRRRVPQSKPAIPDASAYAEEVQPVPPKTEPAAEPVRLTELTEEAEAQPVEEGPVDEGPVEAIAIVDIFGEQPAGSLLTVVELLNKNDAAVDSMGRVSLMVIDTSGDAPKKVERWDFSPEEAADSWQSTSLGDGLHLELPLENDLTDKPGLELWARFVADDGRKILTRHPFRAGELLSVEVAMAAQPLPAPSAIEETWQAQQTPEDPPAVAAVEPTMPETPDAMPETLQPRAVEPGEVRIVTSPIPQKARPKSSTDGWKSSATRPQTASLSKQPMAVARAVAAVRGESAASGWKKSSIAVPVAGQSAPAQPSWKTGTRASKSAPEWSPYR